jgi:hypothetical protein
LPRRKICLNIIYNLNMIQVTCWHWYLLLCYVWNVAAFCNNTANARMKWKLVISVHYVATHRFEWLLYVWEFECVTLNASFVAPFLCNVPHSPLQSKVGKTMPKGISENAIGLWTVLISYFWNQSGNLCNVWLVKMLQYFDR